MLLDNLDGSILSVSLFISTKGGNTTNLAEIGIILYTFQKEKYGKLTPCDSKLERKWA